MIISRRRIGLVSGHRAGDRIEVIFPDQFVREREGVALKLKSAQGRLVAAGAVMVFCSRAVAAQCEFRRQDFGISDERGNLRLNQRAQASR